MFQPRIFLVGWKMQKQILRVPLGIFHMKIFLIRIFIILLTLKIGIHYGRQDYRNLKPIKHALNMMRKYNPVIVPYNYLVQEALVAAENGDMNPFFKLLSALEKPFEFSPSNEIFLNSPLDPNTYYQTFCGTQGNFCIK